MAIVVHTNLNLSWTNGRYVAELTNTISTQRVRNTGQHSLNVHGEHKKLAPATFVDICSSECKFLRKLLDETSKQ